MKKFLPIVILIVIVAAGWLILRELNKKPSTPSTNIPNTSQPTPATQKSVAISPYGLDYPIAEFKTRIIKKPFGIYITPQNSPLQPERFHGYHTAVDVEYQDVKTDVPVYAIADGTVVLSEWASGYGGVFMISFDLKGVPHTALYGHIRPSSLPKVGQKIKKGQKLAVLGTGYSHETDGERRHLHFGVLSNYRIDTRGYVQVKSELSGWLNPLTLYY